MDPIYVIFVVSIYVTQMKFGESLNIIYYTWA